MSRGVVMTGRTETERGRCDPTFSSPSVGGDWPGSLDQAEFISLSPADLSRTIQTTQHYCSLISL